MGCTAAAAAVRLFTGKCRGGVRTGLDGHADADRDGEGHDESGAPVEEVLVCHDVRCSHTTSAGLHMVTRLQQCYVVRPMVIRLSGKEAYLDASHSDRPEEEPASVW